MLRERTPPQVVPQQCSGFRTEARIKRLRTEPSSARAVAAMWVEVESAGTDGDCRRGEWGTSET